MDRRTAAEEIKSRWRELYPADGSGKGIICPLCKSGSGKHGTGLREAPDSKVHALACFHGGCNLTGKGNARNIIDIYMMERGIHSYVLATDELAAQLRIPIDTAAAPATRPTAAANHSLMSRPQQAAHEQKQRTAYKEYYFRCRDNLLRSDAAQAYLRRRGISIENAARNFIGYDPAWINPVVRQRQQAKGSTWLPPAKPVIILPSSLYHYVARDIRPSNKIPEREREYIKSNVGSPDIFGFKNAFKRPGADVVFVTEGAFDALSVMEVGPAAIALNSTCNAENLIDELEKQPTAATLILCLDNDQAGQEATKILTDGLTRLKIRNITANISGGCNDPNEALTTDRAAFEAAIKDVMQAVRKP